MHALRRGSCAILVRDRQFFPQGKPENQAFDVFGSAEISGTVETSA